MTLTFLSALYVALVCVMFYIIRRKFRITLLSIAGIGYVFLLDPYAGIAVLCAALFTWLTGLLIAFFREKGQTIPARITAASGIIICVALILLMKSYVRFPFMLDESSILSRFILPIGFSFYMFQAVSYLADVSRGIVPAEKNIFRMILYLAWFPKFVSGPIERKKDMDAQLEKVQDLVLFDSLRWSKAAHYILTGLFYKLVIADRIGIYVDKIWDVHTGLGSVWLFVGMILYSFQIYCDFAGYSYAAIGFSLIFGIRLTENFRLPYCSSNITEFWRRWHCSLSSWLKDYVYIPLGGNRKGNLRKIVNTLTVFLVCGLWHGESASFLVWGLLHGVYSAFDSVLARRGAEKIRKGWIGRIITFFAVSLAWIFFRAGSFSNALRYLSEMLTAGIRLDTLSTDFHVIFEYSPHDLWIILVTLAVLFVAELMAYKREMSVPELIIGRRYYIQYIVAFIILVSVMILGMYGPVQQGTRMIYMRF